MTITVQYETLFKRAAGTSSEQVDVDEPCRVEDVLQEVAGRHTETLRPLLLDATGDVRPSVMIFVGDRQVTASDSPMLRDGDIVTLMSPISGG